MELYKRSTILIIILLIFLYSLCFAASPQPKVVIAGGDVTCNDEWCQGDTIILTSQTGDHWQIHKPDIMNQNQLYINGLTFFKGKFFLGGNCAVFESSDAKQWHSTYSNCFRSLIKANNHLFGMFYNFLSDDGYVYSSQDGTDFNLFLDVYEDTFTGIAFGQNKYVVVGYYTLNPGAGGEIYISEDNGANWKNLTPTPLKFFFRDIIFHDRFVAVADEHIAVSEDGYQWKYLDTDANLRSITWGAGIFVAVGLTGKITISEDGYLWKSINTNVTQALNKVLWAPQLKKFIAVGDGGTILTSENGRKWLQKNSKTSMRLSGIAIV